MPILLDDVKNKHLEKPIVVSPDHGGVVRARSLAKRVECDLAIIDKRRPKANVSEVMNIIGDVTGKDCIIVDDLVDTAGTLCKAAAALLKETVPVVLLPIVRTRCCRAQLSSVSMSRCSMSWWC